jgi:hypothetical protein
MFGPVASDFEFERHSATIEWESTESWTEFFIDRFGPMVTAREKLGDRFEELREQTVAIFEERNEADDGTLVLPQEYLLAIARL